MSEKHGDKKEAIPALAKVLIHKFLMDYKEVGLQRDSEVAIINQTCYNFCILRLIDMTSCLIL